MERGRRKVNLTGVGRGAEVGGSAEWEVGGSVAVEGCVVVEVGVVVDGRGEEEVSRCDETVVVGGMAAGAR